MIKTILLLLLGLTLSFTSYTQTGIPVSQMSSCDNYVTDFLSTYDIPGATFALTKNGKLIYLRAFGHADLAGQEPTQPYHMFRIASLSKPITSIAIMQMIENGELALSDQVFGTGGLLENHAVLAGADITDPDIYLITVQNLLEHSAGWDRNTACTPNPTPPYGFQFSHCDPIGFPLYVTQLYGTSNPVSEEDLILFLLENGLDFAPNTAYSYSNIGYLVLGEIIEELSGMTYEAYVQSNVLEPLGIYDMHIAKNLLADKREREGEYEGNGYTILSCYGSGAYVPWEYGGFNIEAMDAHGGWIATARDLVRLLVAVDGFSTKPDILSQSTIASMVSPSANFSGYAKGWSVNQYNNWWHTGALDGTATVFARTAGGYTWAILLNKRIIDSSSGAFWGDFDNLPWSCITGVSSFPTHDLMLLPSENSGSVDFTTIGATSIELSWEPGDGNNRLLVVKEGPGISDFPLDGTSYSADPFFGNGDDLGNNTYVVYNGNGNMTTINGLIPNTTYSFRLFEFNQSVNTGNYPLYLLSNSAENLATTSTSTGIYNPRLDHLVKLYPSLATRSITIQVDEKLFQADYSVYNISGQKLMQGRLEGASTLLPIDDLKAGFYYVVIAEEMNSIRKKFVKLAH